MKKLMKMLIKALVEVEMQMIYLIKTNNPSMALHKSGQQEHSLQTIGE